MYFKAVISYKSPTQKNAIGGSDSMSLLLLPLPQLDQYINRIKDNTLLTKLISLAKRVFKFILGYKRLIPISYILSDDQ